jgi:hypothetical protein
MKEGKVDFNAPLVDPNYNENNFYQTTYRVGFDNKYIAVELDVELEDEEFDKINRTTPMKTLIEKYHADVSVTVCNFENASDFQTLSDAKYLITYFASYLKCNDEKEKANTLEIYKVTLKREVEKVI